MKIQIEESALDSLKAMVQQLQDERNEGLRICKNVVEHGIGTSDVRQMREFITACTETKQVLV